MENYKLKRTLLDASIFGYLLVLLLIAVFKPSQEQVFNLSSSVWIALVAVVFGAVASMLLNNAGIKTLGQTVFEPAYEKAKAKSHHKSWLKTFWGMQLLVAFVVTVYVSVKVTKFSLWELTDIYGISGALRLFEGIATPEFSILPKAVAAIFETIFIAFLATVLAVPLAFLLSFLCAKNIMGGTVLGFIIYNVLRTTLNFSRAVEALIWAIIFSVWVGIGPFAGMLALMIHSVASLAKQYSEYVECVDEGPIEGIRSTGASPMQVIWFAVVPQIVLPYISYTIYRWDINVRMATIIGLVGGGGIGTLLIQYQGQAMWNYVGTIILVIAITVWAMDTASAYIREAIK